MKKNRIIAILTAAALSAGILSGCSSSGENTGSETQTETSSVSAETSATFAAENETTAAPLPAAEPADSGIVTSVTADSTEGSCILTDTSFTLTTSEDADSEALRQIISLKPDMPFDLEKVSVCTYKLKTRGNFPEDSMAVLSVGEKDGSAAYRWAFQTKAVFTVRSTYPSDGYEYARPDTGIEIYFSSPVDSSAAESYVSITPEVKGRFESHRNTLCFIPGERLPAGNYSITVKAGFPSADGVLLEEDKSFGFRVEKDRDGIYCYTSGISETYLPDDAPAVEIYCSEELKSESQKYDLEIFRYGSAEDYAASLMGFASSGEYEEDYIFSLEGLTSVYSDRVSLIDSENRWGPAFMLLPDSLEEGYYIADIKTSYGGHDIRIQRHIQINTLSVYASELSGTAQFFINDTLTGKAAENASITVEKPDGTSVAASAGRDGVALVDFRASSRGSGVMLIKHGGRTYCDIYSYRGKADTDMGDLYYSYVYSDREAYLPADTVKIWGVVRPRKQGIPMPRDLELRIGSFWDGEAPETFPVTLSENGTFTAEYTYRDHTDMWGSIWLYSGEDMLASKYMHIEDYKKPTYVFGVDMPDYVLSPQSEPVKSSVSASFYDGTPAEGLTFRLSDYRVTSADPDTVVTDKEGRGETSLLFKDRNSWQPDKLRVTWQLAGVEDVYTYGYGSTWGFFRDVMLESEYSKDTRSLKVSAHMIDPANAYKEESDYRMSPDLIRGAAADVTVKGELTRIWYEKKENGTYYDKLLKQNITRYEYKMHEDIVGSYTVNTSGGEGVFTALPADDEDSYYTMKLTYKDTKGRETECTAYLSNYISMYGENTKKYYTLETDNGSRGSEDYGYYDVYGMTPFKEGQEISFVLRCNNKDVPDEGGRVLLQLC